MNEEGQPQKKSGTGLEPNVAGLLCYVLGWITGIVFFLIEKDDDFVRFHAAQSIIVFGSLSILSILVSVVFVPLFAFSFLFQLMWLLSAVIWIGSIVLWILLMVKAYQGEVFKVPIAGNIAENMV